MFRNSAQRCTTCSYARYYFSAPFTSVPFSPLFAPTPLLNARLPTTHIAHHPSPPRTTPHSTTHTLHNVAPPQHTPLALGSAVATLRTFHAQQSTSKPLHHNSPQHCTQSHNVVKSGLNLVISTIHTSHNVVQSELT